MINVILHRALEQRRLSDALVPDENPQWKVGNDFFIDCILKIILPEEIDILILRAGIWPYRSTRWRFCKDFGYLAPSGLAFFRCLAAQYLSPKNEEPVALFNIIYEWYPPIRTQGRNDAARVCRSSAGLYYRRSFRPSHAPLAKPYRSGSRT